MQPRQASRQVGSGTKSIKLGSEVVCVVRGQLCQSCGMLPVSEVGSACPSRTPIRGFVSAKFELRPLSRVAFSAFPCSPCPHWSSLVCCLSSRRSSSLGCCLSFRHSNSLGCCLSPRRSNSLGCCPATLSAARPQPPPPCCRKLCHRLGGPQLLQVPRTLARGSGYW